MAKGKAHGVNRDYQVFTRDIIQKLKENAGGALAPYKDDGIDVSFDLGGGKEITFDVALSDANGDIVVGECKRWGTPVKQSYIFEFAYRVELLRKHTGLNVAGVFFTKTNYQIGAVAHADFAGIDIVVCNEGQSLQNFVLSYQKYDAEREKRVQKAEGYFTGEATFSGSLGLKVIRKDSAEEEANK